MQKAGVSLKMLPARLLKQLPRPGRSAGEIGSFLRYVSKGRKKKNLHSKPTKSKSEWAKNDPVDQTPSKNETYKTVHKLKPGAYCEGTQN